MSWDAFFAGWDNLRQDLSDFLGISPHSACRLNTVDQDGILVADNCSMASLVAVQGSLRLMGEAEFEQACDTLDHVLRTPLSHPGHALQMVFAYDPSEARADIARRMRPAAVTARNLGLDLGHVLDDWSQAVASCCAGERTYLAFWTSPAVMTRAELSKVRREVARTPRPRVRTGLAQSDAFVLERMRDLHLAVARDLVAQLSSLRIRARLLDSHEAVRAIRAMNVPSLTAAGWRPCLPGDRLPVRLPEPGSGAGDLTHAFPPGIARQVWPCRATIHRGRYVEVHDRIHAPFALSLPPQTPLPFNVLFKSLLAEGIPWRASILLTGDGLRGQGLKSVAASILAFTSTANRLYQQAYRQLQDLALAGECSVVFQMTFTTWVDLGEGQGARGNAPADRRVPETDLGGLLRELSRRAARLMTAVQSWGSCDTTMLTGDPLALYTSTLPAMAPVSPAARAVAPLPDAVRLLPVTRPCSPWDAPGDVADVPLRTSDGKFMPVALFSPRQASWNEIAFAGMGAGKSFFLNTLNFFFVLRAGQVRLPWLTVIDVGVSCSGVISLIRAALPPERRHLAVFARLRNTRESAVNPFDTPLGCPEPLPNHAGFLVNLLALVCTPLNETSPADGVTDLLGEAVAATYRRLAPEGEAPRRFDPYAEPSVTAWLGESGTPTDQATTWWELVRLLFGAGRIDLAVRAQRHAVPTISDVMGSINNPLVRDRFARILVRGSSESIPEACVRHLTSALQDYPVLAHPTRFDLGAAQIVGLDLQEVTPRGGPAAERQSGIMYLLARHVGAGHFFQTVADLDRIPASYRGYHRPRFENLAADPKRLCYDEFHRASCADMNNPLSRQIIADLTTASRESRKQNLSIGLYTQQLSDFPKALVDLATSVYALGAGNAHEAAEIAGRFGFNEAAHLALRRIARPTAAGANFVALYRTSDGESIQYLTNTAGPYARWAFSTTAEDMRVRNFLYERLGCGRALDVLRQRYPSGTIRDELERRKLLMEAHAGEAAEDPVREIAEELLALGRGRSS